MILDKKQEFSDAQAITVTAASTNVIDAGEADDDREAGDEQYLHVRVNTTFATLTSLVVALEESADNETYNEVIKTPAILAATLVQGYWILKIKIAKPLKRYRRLYYTVDGSDATAGKIDGWIGPGTQSAVA